MRFVYKVGIVAVFSSFLLMSHNVSAVSTVLNMNEYDVVGQQGQLPVNCEFYGVPTSQSNVTECTARANTTSAAPTLAFLRKMSSVSKWTVKTGDIIEFDLNVFTPVSSYAPYRVHLYFLGGSADFTAMEYKQTVDNNHYTSTTMDTVMYQSVYHVTYRARHDGDVYIGLTSSQHWFEWMSGNDTYMTFAIYNVMHYRYSGSQVNKEQEEATQNAVDDSESAAEDNSSSTQTTNLIGAFQSFVTALTSLNSTNCNVTLPFPSALGGSMQVNICQNKDYAGNIVSVFGSLTLIVFYIPFSLKILSMIYNEIRSFTNG